MPAIARVEPLTTTRAVRGPFDYRLPAELGEVAVGSLLRVPFQRQELVGVVVGLGPESEVPVDRLRAPLEALEASVPPDLVRLAIWIAEAYGTTVPRALSLVVPPKAVKPRRKRVPAEPSASPPPVLTPAQAAAVAQIEAALDAGEHERILLHGVTGSGKTEVYLRAIGTTLARGRGVIMLVPEIVLTPQTVARVTARFGDTVAVLHSRLTAGERHEAWSRLRDGDARVCVGPRSAVFAPVGDLGLVVVDEEHDASYKHEGDPRYDARAVAARRASDAGAVVLAGSATPRPESVHRLHRLRLPERVAGEPLPPVELLDMCEAPGVLHPRVREGLGEVARAGGKAIVLLNRRGWAAFVSCRACGHVPECPSCDVTLVLHRGARTLACHHCGHREPAVDRCAACASPSVARHGAGTERLEEELRAAVGELPVVRLDADAGDPAPVLERFLAQPAAVLVGTQLVAKGHDVPGIGLGVVVDADATLRFPDFRAEERTFALVTQLAGRVGRGGAPGRVLVQTLAPDTPALVHAARHDSDAFVAEELERRRALRYPPFAELIQVVCSSPQAGAAQAAAQDVRARLTGHVLGPAPLMRLRGRERMRLLVKAARRAPAVREAGAAVAAVAPRHRGVAFSVDVDPH